MAFLHERFGGSSRDAEDRSRGLAPKGCRLFRPVPGLRYDGRYNLRTSAPAGAEDGRCCSTPIPTSCRRPRRWTTPGPARGGRDRLRPRRLRRQGQVAAIYLRCAPSMRWRSPPRPGAGAPRVEEENGGNGTLAHAAGGVGGRLHRARALGRRLYPSVRGRSGSVSRWPARPATADRRQTAQRLLMARDAIAILERYHADS